MNVIAVRSNEWPGDIRLATQWLPGSNPGHAAFR